MDSVFDAQFRNIRDSLLERGVDVRVEYRPDGEVDFVYQAHRILAPVPVVNDLDSANLLADALPGLEAAPESHENLRARGLQLLSTENLRGFRTVPQALEHFEDYLRERSPEGYRDRARLAGPNHLMHVSAGRACPADEPSVPSGNPTDPWPAVRTGQPCKRTVKVGVSDTGLLDGAPAEHSWLAGVTGELDDLGPVLPDGSRLIQEYDGHGTFIAGVVRTMAPDAAVHVTDHFTAGGALLETEVIDSLERLISTFAPDIISLSAGSYTRNDWEPLSFARFRTAHPGLTLVAAAGNESTDRPFYPAAFDWVIAVGALGTDQQHRAWFSNFGAWVDVYALGEGMVNAYATGRYDYQEPPRRPSSQSFAGMARWDGTSFATPLVAGLIAARMAANPAETSDESAQAVLSGATPVDGVGPALLV